MRNTIKSPDAGKLVPKTADEIVKLEDQAQCFTPITKKILEKVGQDCTQGASNSSHSSTAKRNINFGTTTIADLGNVAPELPDSQPATIVETPKKKNNGEEQNVQPA